MTLFETVAESARRGADRPAIVEHGLPGGPRATRYGELVARVGRMRAALAALGFRAGQILPIAAERSADAVAVALAAAAEGGAFCWVNPRLRAMQVAPIVAATAPVGLVIDDEGARSLSAATPEERALLRPIALADLAAGRGGARRSAEARAGGAAGVLFTSGSTGTPKGVLISDADLVARAAREVACFALDAGDRLLGLLPLSFDVGLNQLHAALACGASVHFSPAWLPREMTSIVHAEHITGISAVPGVWTLALGGPPEERVLAGASSLRYVTVSGGSLPAAAFDALAGKLDPHVAIHRTYGQSETFRSAIFFSAAAPEHAARRASVGRAVPGTRVFIAADRTRLAEPGEEGEVLHGGDGTMLGYLGDPALTREKLGGHAAVDGPVVFTGDRGRLDADGYLYLAGRADAMMKTSGFRVYPGEVEDVLARHPGVVEAVVLGVPDALLGERIVAVVVLRAGLDAAEVRAFAAARLASYMLPRAILSWTALPRTATGKPALREIRERVLADLG